MKPETLFVVDQLKKLHACEWAIKWAESGKFQSMQEAWDACERGDWMLWLAAKRCRKRGSKAHRHLVLAACECARQSLKFVPKGDDRPFAAIETAEKWASGDESVSLDDVRNAAYAYTAAADSAADSAAYAAEAADSAADAAAYAAAAYAAAAYAAAYAAAAYAADAYAADAADSAADVRDKSLRESAAIVRKFIPNVPTKQEKK
jgi:hypothetical protein